MLKPDNRARRFRGYKARLEAERLRAEIKGYKGSKVKTLGLGSPFKPVVATVTSRYMDAWVKRLKRALKGKSIAVRIVVEPIESVDIEFHLHESGVVDVAECTPDRRPPPPPRRRFG